MYKILHQKKSESEGHSVGPDSLQPCGLYGPWNSPGQNIGVGSLFLLWEIFPTQRSNPSVLHCRVVDRENYCRILVWFPFTWGVKVKVNVAQSCPTLCDPMDYTVHGILQARMLEWVAFPFSRGSSQPRDGNPGLPHCRGILYQLSHKGSPRILEKVAYPFSSRSSWPRN